MFPGAVPQRRAGWSGWTRGVLAMGRGSNALRNTCEQHIHAKSVQASCSPTKGLEIGKSAARL